MKRKSIQIGDLVKFIGTWTINCGPKTGIVTQTWTSGRSGRLSSVDVIWDNGREGNVLAEKVKVVND